MRAFKRGLILAGVSIAAAGGVVWLYANMQTQRTSPEQAAASLSARAPTAKLSVAQSAGSAPTATMPGAAGQTASSSAPGTKADKPVRELAVNELACLEWLSFTGGGEALEPVKPEVIQRDDGYTIRVRLPGMNKRAIEERGEVYAALEVPGWGLLQEVGKPSVPVKNILLDIPANVEPAVHVAGMTLAKAAPLSIYPAQPPYPDVRPEPPRPPFQKDAVIYNSNELWPVSPIIRYSVNKMRNRRILSIEVTPVQVRAASREALVAESLDITVDFKKKAENNAKSEEILPDGFTNGVAGRYMILTHDKYATNTTLQTFMDWKRRKGYDVQLVKASDIDAGGAPTNGQVVAYLRALAATNYPEYLLIIGDHTPTNGIQGQYMITSDGGWSDLTIACRDDSDYFPDLCCGRLPAVNNTYLTLMLNNVMAMDRTPTTNNMYQKVCVAGMIQDYNDYNNVADRLFCETADLIACYFEQRAGFSCQRAVVNPDGVNSNCLWNPSSILWNSTNKIGSRVYDTFVSATTARERITNNVNSGIAILQHRDHGYSGGYGWADPYFINTHVQALTNGVKTPVVFSINCASGAYHVDRFLRAWFQNSQGGAYAVFAPVDISYSWYNDWLTHGFYTAFLTNYVSFQNTSANPAWPKQLPDPGGTYGTAGSCPRLGEILNFGKLYLYENYSSPQTTFKLFHLFGDPEAFLQIETPATQNVTHAAHIGLGNTTLVVSNLEANAQVCLYSDTLEIQQVTNASGSSASFNVNPSVTGTIYVTVTRYGSRPYEGTIEAGGAIVEFSAAQYEAAESSASAWITVTRSGDTNDEITVDFIATNSTALAGSDFTATNGTLTFAANVITNGFGVSILEDDENEGYENISLQLCNLSSNAVFGSISNAVLRIEDNDSAGQFCFSSSTYSASESNASAVIAVLRANGSTGSVSVAFTTSNGTAAAGSDYTAASGVLSYADGVTSNSFSVSIISDQQDESDETISLILSNPSGGAVLTSPSNAVLTIVDNDNGGTLSFSATAYTVSETNENLDIWVMRAGGSDGAATVNFAASNGTAVAGSDFIATNGVLALADGVTSNYFTIAITNVEDGVTNETFSIHLSDPDGATLASPSAATVTVWDAAMLLSEGFESGSLPAGWSNEYVSGSLDWVYQNGGYTGGQYPSSAHSGSYNACLYYGGYADKKTKLATKPVDFGTYTNGRLTFWHYMEEWASDQDELRVYYKTSAGGAWNLLATYISSVESWTQRTLSLANINHICYIAFEGDANYGFGVCIDDVQIIGTGTNESADTTAPSAPTGLVMTERSINSIAISWKASIDNVAVAGYRVYRNGSAVGALTGLSYTNTILMPGMVYTNQVYAYDAAGNISAPSTALVVTTLQIVAVTVQPRSVTNSPGTTASFSVSAAGTEPLYYQWLKDGADISGAVLNTYTITSITKNDEGGYCCVVSNNTGSVISDTATLTIKNLPSVPAGVRASDGTFTNKISITWNASADAVSYEVWRNTTNLSTTASMLAAISGTNYDDFTAVIPGRTLYYWVKAKNDSGASAFSQPDSGYCGADGATGVADLSLRGFLFQPAAFTTNMHPEMVMLMPVNNGPDRLANSGIGFDFFLSGNAVFGDNDDLWIGDYQAAVSIDAGSFTSVIISDTGLDGITIPSTASGAYYVFARVRHTSAILDPDMNNNIIMRSGAIAAGNDGSGAKEPVAGDFDGDRSADPCVYQESTGNWYLKFSGGEHNLGQITGFGGEGWKPVSGDFDGDGKSDPAIYQESSGDWRIMLSGSGYAELVTSLGGLGYAAVLGDFNGGGHADLAVYREATGYWLVILMETEAPIYFKFGQDGYAPVTGDYTGEGTTELALYQETTGNWYVKLGDNVYQLSGFGGSGYQPVGGDYDGDGLEDLMLYQAGTGSWLVRLSGSGYAIVTIEDFGGPDYVPVSGDYDGDGLSDLVIYNTATSTWLSRLSSAGYDQFSTTF